MQNYKDKLCIMITERRIAVNGFSLERVTLPETLENGLIVRRETLDNGIRVVSIESLVDEKEIPRTVEQFMTPETEGLDTHISNLNRTLEVSEGQLSVEVRDAIMLIGREMHSVIRGVCETDKKMQELPDDGIVYFFTGQSQGWSIEAQSLSILTQLEKYATK